MIIDCHAHYEPRILDVKALIQKMDGAGITKTVLIPLLTDPPETKKSDILMGIQRFMLDSRALWHIAAFITKSMYRKSGEWNMWFKKFSSNSQKLNIVQRPDNKSVVNVISKYPNRLLGWIFINPINDDSMEELEKCRNIKGMIGVKIHPFWHRFSIEKVDKIARRAEELGLPMLVHLGFDNSGDYMWLIKNFPKLKIIFAHLGVPYYRTMWTYVVKSPNLFVDISSTYHVNENLLRKAITVLGPHKCIFGTDAPYAHEDSVVRIKRWVECLDISSADKERIFSENFLELVYG